MRVLVVSADRTLENGYPQNIGDAFLTDCLALELQRFGHEVRVADAGAGQRRSSSVERVQSSGLRAFDRAVRWSDVVVLGGGTLLADDQPDRAFGGLPRLCLVTVGLGLLHRRRVAVFGVGRDPVNRRRVRLALDFVVRRSRVWMRDSESAGRSGLDRQGERLPVSGDVSLLAFSAPFMLPAPEAERMGATVALNRREAALLEVEHVESLRERFGTVRFLSMDQGGLPDYAAIPASVQGLLATGDNPLDWRETARIIRGSKIVIASRMHAMYMAVMAGVPVVSVGNAPKVQSFVSEFGTSAAPDLASAIRAVPYSDIDRVAARASELRRCLHELSLWMSDAG